VSERGYCTNWGKSAKHWEGSAHLPAVLDGTVIQPGCPSRVGAGPGQKDAKATLFPGVRPSTNSYPYPQSPIGYPQTKTPRVQGFATGSLAFCEKCGYGVVRVYEVTQRPRPNKRRIVRSSKSDFNQFDVAKELAAKTAHHIAKEHTR
jgi:hypothetical protein